MSLEIRPVRGTAEGERGKRFFVRFMQEWSFLFGRHDWDMFTLIHASVERASYAGRLEFDFWLLGVGLQVTYVYDHTFGDAALDFKEHLQAEVRRRLGDDVQFLDPTQVLDQIAKAVSMAKAAREAHKAAGSDNGNSKT